MSRSKILFQLSGSIACYKACHAISRLVQKSFEVQAVATPSALKFVGTATLEGLTGRPVLTDTFEPGRALDHIALAQWADIAILCPATANRINSLSAGLADDLVGALFLAWDFAKPYWVAPAMNPKMLTHPATRASLAKLESWGVRVLPTDEGRLACGDQGEGKLLDPDELVRRLEDFRGTRPSGGKRILVTTGGTWESVDGIRYLANSSTGRTGTAIAEYLAAAGHEITCLHSTHGVRPATTRNVAYSGFEDLAGSLQRLLETEPFDAVIHAAAVSDYSVDSVVVDGKGIVPPLREKLSSGSALSLNLRPNRKLVDEIRAHAGGRPLTLVAFKLTHDASPEARLRDVYALSRREGIDYVVHNDLSEIGGPDGRHRARIYRHEQFLTETEDHLSLARELDRLLSLEGANA